VSKRKLFILAFIEGAFVISVELLGGKMLSPIFGSSVYIWTSIIGVTLTCITAGYLIGGILSTKSNPEKNLFILFFLAGIFSCLMPFLAENVFLSFLEKNLFFSCITMSLILLAVPLICLGAVSPILIQSFNSSVVSSGKTAGRFYAVSTTGGIINTYLLGFIIIPAFSINFPLLISCVILILSTFFINNIKPLFRVTGLLVFIVAAVIMLYGTERTKDGKSFKYIYESEGIMGQLKVVDYLGDNGLFERALLSNNSAQSIITRSNVTAISRYNYVHLISTLSSMKAKGGKVLLLGMAGGSLVYELQNLGFSIDVVDIDARTFYVAERYFYFQKNRTRLYTDDARHFIKTSKNKYDMVIIDISSSEVQPSYLYTIESFNEVKKILNPDGFFFVNFMGILEGDSKLAEATWSIDTTLRVAGFNPYHYSFQKEKANDIQFIASPAAIDFSKLDSSRLNLCCSQNVHIVELMKTKSLQNSDRKSVQPMLLTDDKPVLDKLKFETVMELRNTIRKEIRKRETLLK
jgi:spermidine synthase